MVKFLLDKGAGKNEVNTFYVKELIDDWVNKILTLRITIIQGRIKQQMCVR